MNLRRPLLFLAVVLVTSLRPLPALAQEEPSEFAKGTHVFRRLLYDQSGQKLHVLDGQIDDPARMLLIVLGDPSPLERLNDLYPKGLAGFVNDGGAVLVATDRYTDGAVLRPLAWASSATLWRPRYEVPLPTSEMRDVLMSSRGQVSNLRFSRTLAWTGSRGHKPGSRLTCPVI